MIDTYACHGCGQKATWNENNVVKECSHCNLREFAFGVGSCKYQWDVVDNDIHYIVTWFADITTITVFEKSMQFNRIELNDLLPLNITLDQVKLYLTFS